MKHKEKIIFLFLIFVFTLSIQAQDQCKCCTTSYDQFDFWVGEWDVFNKDGKQVGTNIISERQDNCVLVENWKSSNGKITGTSYNFYNSETGFWEQLWLDNQGGVLKLKGKKEGNQMILYGDKAGNGDGSYTIDRITWTAINDGTVRQLWEKTKDSIQWNTVFDGLYKKKKD